MTVYDLNCRNKACPDFGAPISEIWRAGQCLKVFCPSCDYVVSPDMAIPRGESEPVNQNNRSNNMAAMLVGVFISVVIVLMVVLILTGGGGTEDRYTTIDVDGARCIYDRHTEEIEDCNFGTVPG